MDGGNLGRLFTAISCSCTMVWGWEFPSPKVVSVRAKTDTFGYRKYKGNLQLFTVLREVGNSGTSLLISTAHKLPCSSSLLRNCYQPEQLKTSHTSEISHYILHPVIIHSSLRHHSNIVKCRSNGNISSVETLCPTFITVPLLRTEQDTEQNTRKSVSEFPDNTLRTRSRKRQSERY